ncbi:MAG TPA: polysaccharide deacetylase family protein [Chthoniobacteraceae bacterium]|nr:polysaccharide deacetylase family protein [Chthoniobacteraceae bacterium]
MKIRHVFAHCALALLVAFGSTGCGKIKLPFGKKSVAATPAPATPAPTSDKASETSGEAAVPAIGESAPAAEPTTPATPAHPPIDRNAQVVVLCYHRLEGKAGGSLSIEPALFEKHMQELKDKGLSVISMQDFLAWRRGEKSIPSKSVLITIDDGYVSGIEVGVPILKKYAFPATFFVYLDYINKGGKSVTWAQLGELRDQGFDIGSHTVSHQDLRRKHSKSKIATYEEWLKDEVQRSKEVIEEQLGIKCGTIAYPYGHNNAKVHAAVQAAGYEAGFTTYGQRIGISASAFAIGRYDVTAKDAQGHDGFTAAVSFDGAVAPSGGPVLAQEAQGMMITEPMNGAVINSPTPTLKANLASLGALDEGTVKMRVAGVGIVPATFDSRSKMLSYKMTQPLRPGDVTVIVSATAKGQPVETRWRFKVDPNAQPSSPDAAGDDLPPRRAGQ